MTRHHAAPAFPAAVRLPDEVWLIIASNLPYTSLKVLERTSRHFDILTKDKSLDSHLFRAEADGKLAPVAKYSIHPLLEVTAGATYSGTVASASKAFARYRLPDPRTLAAVGESATSPASSLVHLTIARELDDFYYQLYSQNGVTVRMIFDAL